MTAGINVLASPDHRDQHMRHHISHAAYGTHGYRWAGMVAELAERMRATTVLDYGAGKRSLAPAVRNISPGLDVREYDPCVPDIAHLPEPAEIVVCVDTLIFVEEDKLDAVLDHIEVLATKAVLINVPFHPAHKLAVQPSLVGGWFLQHQDQWWLDTFADRWPAYETWVVEPKDADHTRYLWFEGRV